MAQYVFQGTSVETSLVCQEIKLPFGNEECAYMDSNDVWVSNNMYDYTSFDKLVIYQ